MLNRTPFASTPFATRGREGFTLVELLVAMGLMIILVTILAQIMATASDVYDLSSRRAQVYSSGRIALDVVEEDITHAIPLTYSIPDANGEFPLGLVSDELVFEARSLPLPATIQTSPTDEYTNRYIDMDASPMALPLQVDVESHFVLAFFSNVRYFDPATSRFRYGPARVVYYMRKRAPDREVLPAIERPGSHLIRRIEPYYIIPADPVLGPPSDEFHWGIPGDDNYRVEDEVASYVRAFEVHYLDRSINTEATAPVPPDMRYRECRQLSALPPLAPPQGPWNGVKACCQWRMQTDPWSIPVPPALPAPFTANHFLPPALLIKITVCDDNGIVHREFQRVINLDSVVADVPLKPFQY